MNVRDVARRIGGQDSHPGFHRVLANGYPLDALIRISQAFAAKTAVGRHDGTGFDHNWVASGYPAFRRKSWIADLRNHSSDRICSRLVLFVVLSTPRPLATLQSNQDRDIVIFVLHNMPI